MNKTPETFLIGVTTPNLMQLQAYLEHTNQLEFWPEIQEAYEQIGPMALSSFYAKLCYKSLVLGKNDNITRIRSVQDNLKSVIQTGHGSVLEHVWFNFVTTDCSRVFTHELVRHRVGTAFSQTSGRYVSLDQLDLVLPPELLEDQEAMLIVKSLNAQIEHGLRALRRCVVKEDMDFTTKKKLTSAIRRLAPNGQVNEIGWSANIRSLRHMIEMRTSRHAEWEIRLVFNQVVSLLHSEWPMILEGGSVTEVDGLEEWTGLKI